MCVANLKGHANHELLTALTVNDRYAATSSDWDPTVRIQVQATKGSPKLKRSPPKHSRSVTRAAWSSAPNIRTSPYHRCLRLHATQV